MSRLSEILSRIDESTNPVDKYLSLEREFKSLIAQVNSDIFFMWDLTKETAEKKDVEKIKQENNRLENNIKLIKDFLEKAKQFN